MTKFQKLTTPFVFNIHVYWKIMFTYYIEHFLPCNFLIIRFTWELYPYSFITNTQWLANYSINLRLNIWYPYPYITLKTHQRSVKLQNTCMFLIPLYILGLTCAHESSVMYLFCVVML